MTNNLSFKEKENNVNIEDRLRQEHDQWYIDITDIAIEMFGDIVDKVEITDFYDYTMLVTFKNGKKIEIWNSEWGGIRFTESK